MWTGRDVIAGRSNLRAKELIRGGGRGGGGGGGARAGRGGGGERGGGRGRGGAGGGAGAGPPSEAYMKHTGGAMNLHRLDTS